MTESVFKRGWTIRSSTSRFFPVDSEIVLKPKEPPSDGFELEVIWEGHPVPVIGRDFREIESNRSLHGKFDKGEQPVKHFEIVVTLVPVEPGGKKRLLGLVREDRGRDDEGTGVWVAEAKPQEPDPI